MSSLQVPVWSWGAVWQEAGICQAWALKHPVDMGDPGFTLMQNMNAAEVLWKAGINDIANNGESGALDLATLKLQFVSHLRMLERDREDLWRAMLDAAQALGLEAILPRLVASKLPLNWWPDIPDGIPTKEPGLEVPHHCPLLKPHETWECLTALLAEEIINRRALLPGTSDMADNIIASTQLGVRSTGKVFLAFNPRLHDCLNP